MGILRALLRPPGRRKVYADLMNLDDHLLRDIGLTRTDVENMMAGRGRKRLHTHE